MRWTRALSVGACLLVLAAPAQAGLIFGTIRWQDQSAAAGLPIQVQCADPNRRYDGTVQAGGDYRIYVAEVGNCQFRVTVGDRQAAAEVGSYEDEVRYDFLLVRTGDGVQLVRQ